MAQLEAAGISSAQQHPVPTSSSLGRFAGEAHDSTQSLTTQENQATTIHDFLSLCGAAVGRYNSAATAPTHGSQHSSTTQDFLQPLQRSLIPTGSTSTNLRSSSYALCTSKPYGGGNDEHGGGQQSCYALGNGSFEPKESFPSKYRSANITFGPRGHVAHALPLTKHWQQQSGIEVFDGNKRLSRVPSEEDDDEDEESFEHVYSARKDGRNQKGENTQPMDGRNAEKGVTPRSKHSATEQRRRSKINDRFQMLRQLLPNADQKRDKASFLLEVIEYIQMLHEKVKKYEGLDVRGQQQERLKALSWDQRSSGQQDAALSPVQDSKEVPDANGYARSRSSPLTTMSEDGITSSGLMCTMKQVSALQGVLSFDSKPIITKPIPLNFSPAPPSTIIEQGSNQSHQNIIPENQAFFSQLLRQEDQATTKARDLISQKTDTLQPHLLQSRNVTIPQDSHQVEDQRLPCSRYMDQSSLSTLVLRRPEEEAEGQDRTSDATEMGSFVGSFVSKPSIGLDGRAVPACSEQRTEAVPAKVQEEPTVLGGIINISSTYSQGLLDTLTRALQISGVDMAQATISVQIDLGKPESLSSKQIVPLPPMISTPQNQQTVFTNELEPPHKKLKVEAD